MSLEVLRAEFDAHKEDVQAFKVDIKTDIDTVKKTVAGKVSATQFYWIAGVLISIQTLISGYIAMQNSSLYQSVSDISATIVGMQHDISSINRTFNQYDIQVTK